MVTAKEYLFEVPGIPHGQKRARSVVLYKKDGNPVVGKDGRIHPHVYKDKKQERLEIDLAWHITPQRPAVPHNGYVGLSIDAYYPIPKSWPKKKQELAESKNIRPIKAKPDLSNVIKHIEDVMNGLFFVDDKQICSLTSMKYYSYSPRLVIRLYAESEA